MEPLVSAELPERQTMSVDIACVGFGPAMAGFLSTLSRRLAAADRPPLESAAAPGMPLQVVCYERADDLGFGVSGVVRARAASAARSPTSTLRRSRWRRRCEGEGAVPPRPDRRAALVDAPRRGRVDPRDEGVLPVEEHAMELPWTPEFLHKKDGFVFSMGQLMQWMSSQVLATGTVQIWPATPVAQALVEGKKVHGVRLLDQGVDKAGRPEGAYMPGMDVQAALTVVADGPVGAVGRQLDEAIGMPECTPAATGRWG